ncbi:CMP-N-acetylneuraminate-beta-1,4-galactoside alpha-2,3-sialyltransferase-like isoform X1 [Petromyzon marinus]|uniref:CMP-N-acetylneuraminate-beta-1,4-galactoside alpha-2,3-sialyltransferase-like isoform X1 n=1 Tax=Petromyzon marinus TaxID=7757 RepID=UPI003F7296E1
MSALPMARSVLAALCLTLVVGFLYYSSGKLHQVAWAHEPQFDRLGFVLKFEPRGAATEDARGGNGTEPACRASYTPSQMTAIFPKFVRVAPMFLDRSFKRWGRLRDFSPPFGLRGQEKIVNEILAKTKESDLPLHLQSACRRCVIVGSGGILFNKSLGARIDEYDFIIRLNNAPVRGFERDVGARTTMRITYPEGAIQDPRKYEADSLFVFAGFKPHDFRWLRSVVYSEKMHPIQGFWKSVATQVPRRPEDIRILNPYFIREAAFTFIGLPVNNGMMGHGNIPTLGTVAITMALHNCDEVDVAGFGYDMSNLSAPLHYYESTKMSAIKESWTHNIAREKDFLRKLVRGRVIRDLTGGI